MKRMMIFLCSAAVGLQAPLAAVAQTAGSGEQYAQGQDRGNQPSRSPIYIPQGQGKAPAGRPQQGQQKSGQQKPSAPQRQTKPSQPGVRSQPQVRSSQPCEDHCASKPQKYQQPSGQRQPQANPPQQRPAAPRVERRDRDHERWDERAGAPRATPMPQGGPRIGDDGRRGRPFERADHSRFPPPPRGQSYRVLPNGWLVLVDDNTLAIVSVVGLLSLLLLNQ